MEVIVAKTAGFCFGVKRAVEKVYANADKEHVYTYGPIIHNEQVVADLEKRGVKVVDEDADLSKLPQGTIVVRAHGASRAEFDRLRACGMQIEDATCPFVSKIHKIVKQASEDGKTVVIVGSDNHPEVEGIKGWCVSKPIVIESASEAEKLDNFGGKKLCIVSQTTFNYKKFKDIVDILSKKSYDIDVMNTICNATEERQTEAGTIARQSDAMLVIGGKHSSNTQKLYEICRKECENTYFIQTLDDLDLKQFQSFRSVGITAGASTPNTIIKEVQSYVRNE